MVNSPIKYCEKHQCNKKLIAYVRGRDGKVITSYICITCKSEAEKRYRESHRKEKSERSKRYAKDNPEKIKKYRIQYNATHIDEKSEYNKQYRENNIEKLQEYDKQYYNDHKEEQKLKNEKYRKNNKEKIRKNKKAYIATKRNNDPTFRLRNNVSRIIGIQLKANGSSKNGTSIDIVLGKSFGKLMMDYYETLFDYPDNLDMNGNVWMTRDNQGSYKVSEWDDNDPTTWRWNADHIRPHTYFNYTLITDPEFKDCWDLSNLRPLSAKQNVTDGNNRTDEQIVTIKKSIADFLESKKNGKE